MLHNMRIGFLGREVAEVAVRSVEDLVIFPFSRLAELRANAGKLSCGHFLGAVRSFVANEDRCFEEHDVVAEIEEVDAQVLAGVFLCCRHVVST
jgi:hypothetical protein